MTVPMHRFTVPEYHRLIQVGVLTEDDAVELLEGWIVPKMPRNPPHNVAVDLAEELIRARLPEGWRVRIQSAITVDDSEPEPDLAIVPGPANRYTAHHPGPQDVALVIEIADSTLARDRDIKGRLYARVGIPTYWIVNLVDSQVEVYTDPSGPGAPSEYRQRHDYAAHESVPLALAGQEIGRIAVQDLLP